MKPKHENLQVFFPCNTRYFCDHRSTGRSHWHNEIELQYIIEGEALTLCNLQTTSLKKGDILFVNTNELHSGNYAPTHNKFYCFHINKEFFNNHIGNEYVVFENVIRDEECSAIMDEIINTVKSENYLSRIKVGGLLYKFFALCAERHKKAVLNETDFKKHYNRTDKFNDMVKYIEDHYAEPLTVSDLASLFFITPSHFAHFFKRKSGKSVIQFLNEVRITNAQLYLEQDDTPISEIALSVGFDDINYFSRKFKQLTGTTPTEYRAKFK